MYRWPIPMGFNTSETLRMNEVKSDLICVPAVDSAAVPVSHTELALMFRTAPPHTGMDLLQFQYTATNVP